MLETVTWMPEVLAYVKMFQTLLFPLINKNILLDVFNDFFNEILIMGSIFYLIVILDSHQIGSFKLAM